MIPNGVTVFLRGLQDAAEHNGKVGVFSGYDDHKGRYVVELPRGDGERIERSVSLKPTNLTQLVQGVEVTGLENKPQLNNVKGEIIGFQDPGRYMVKLQNGNAVGLQPQNVILPKGTRAMTQLLSKEEFNGKWGKVVDFDREALRYTVAFQDGKQIKIKLENLLC